MKTQIILVDLENVQQPDLLPALKMDNVQVRVFVGPQQPKLPIGLVVAMQELGERAKYIQVSKAGPNALDMHLVFYLGELSQQFPGAYFHIVSKDSDYDPLLTHLKGRGIHSAKRPDLASIPFLKSASAVTPAEQVRAAADWLKKHPKDNRPGTVKTLKSCLNHSVFANRLDDSQLETVVNGLIGRAYVSVSEDKEKLRYPESLDA
ncbi:PIN domain-containing protein [Verminephrobacter eiseniae]|uniref:PIN domain-containing protein n=1 Tax=Verminephrobacter eiseniae TaxID=364317 RepID=UPI002237E5F5|nr:PIN domain-containing protein [Verminephrobacter eiseniae]MCW5237873.1 hypothetical protein [Verminephrobacter eiseniae]